VNFSKSENGWENNTEAYHAGREKVQRMMFMELIGRKGRRHNLVFAMWNPLILSAKRNG